MGSLYWKENKEDIEVQNRDTDIIKYMYENYGEYWWIEIYRYNKMYV